MIAQPLLLMLSGYLLHKDKNFRCVSHLDNNQWVISLQ